MFADVFLCVRLIVTIWQRFWVVLIVVNFVTWYLSKCVSGVDECNSIETYMVLTLGCWLACLPDPMFCAACSSVSHESSFINWSTLIVPAGSRTRLDSRAAFRYTLYHIVVWLVVPSSNIALLSSSCIKLLARLQAQVRFTPTRTQVSQSARRIARTFSRWSEY